MTKQGFFNCPISHGQSVKSENWIAPDNGHHWDGNGTRICSEKNFGHLLCQCLKLESKKRSPKQSDTCKNDFLNNVGKIIKVSECSRSCGLQRRVIRKDLCGSQAWDSAGEAPLLHELAGFIFICSAWTTWSKERHCSSGKHFLCPVKDQVWGPRGLTGLFLSRAATTKTAVEHFYSHKWDRRNATEKQEFRSPSQTLLGKLLSGYSEVLRSLESPWSLSCFPESGALEEDVHHWSFHRVFWGHNFSMWTSGLTFHSGYQVSAISVRTLSSSANVGRPLGFWKREAEVVSSA